MSLVSLRNSVSVRKSPEELNPTKHELIRLFIQVLPRKQSKKKRKMTHFNSIYWKTQERLQTRNKVQKESIRQLAAERLY